MLSLQNHNAILVHIYFIYVSISIIYYISHLLIWKNMCIREDGLINKLNKKKQHFSLFREISSCSFHYIISHHNDSNETFIEYMYVDRQYFGKKTCLGSISLTTVHLVKGGCSNCLFEGSPTGKQLPGPTLTFDLLPFLFLSIFYIEI